MAKIRLSQIKDGANSKTTPVDADSLPIVDSTDTSELKKSTWANIKATLKTYFDTLYKATFTENTAFNKNFGTTSGTVTQGNDSRLSDNRTPTDDSVTPAKLASHFTDTETISASEANWNHFRGTKTISAATTFTFSNLRIGVYMLEITGDHGITLPTGFVYAGGTRASSGAWTAQIVCTDTSTPKGWYVILKDES